MPYKAVDELPDPIKKALPKDAQEIFLAAFNAAAKDGADDEAATKIAWGAVKKKYEKGGDGSWVPLKEATGPPVSIDKRIHLVQQAVEEKFTPKAGPDGLVETAYIQEAFDKYVIVTHKGNLWKVPYSIGADQFVTLDEPVRVEQTYVIVKESVQVGHVSFTAIREAKGKKGQVFEVVILEAGASDNKWNGLPLVYTEEALRESGPKVFEGRAVNAYRIGKVLEEEYNHVAIPQTQKGAFTLNQVGRLKECWFDEGTKTLRAYLHLHEGATFIAGLLKEAVSDGSSDIGLSIDANGRIEVEAIGGQHVALVKELHEPADVDIVSQPAAGGRIIRLAASVQKGEATVGADNKPTGEVNPSVNVEEAVALATVQLKESFKTQLDTIVEGAEKRLKAKEEAHEAELAKLRESAQEAEKKVACGRLLEAKLAGCNLPKKTVDLIRESFQNRAFEENDLDASIEKYREALAEVDTSGRVIVPKVEVLREARDRYNLAVQDWFLQETAYAGPVRAQLKESGAEPFTFFHEMFREITGCEVEDFRFNGSKRQQRLKESLSTTDWAEIFGDNLNKALIQIATDPADQDWRKVVKVVPLKNFMTQHRIRYGGYGNLPVVAERGNYTALTSPGDEENTYAASKYGGTEDLTWEMMLNDDVGAIRDIPMKLGIAWRRTLKEFVFDLLTYSGMPTMDYDSVALFNGAHANYGTTALANAELLVARLAMAKQTELTSGKRIKVNPKYLIVPVDLEVTAYKLVNPYGSGPPGSTTDDSYIKNRMGLEVIVVDYWTDTNDWVLLADPRVYPMLEIGFVGGRQTPELFTQDNVNVGSMFNNDTIVYKIRGAWGGTAVDHRGGYMEHV